MAEFFERRLIGYDEHMLTNIESANEFYPYTANLLPKETNAEILDLGCGTGLELSEYFKINPSAKITGIDLSKGMLNALKEKFSDKDIAPKTVIPIPIIIVPSPIFRANGILFSSETLFL